MQQQQQKKRGQCYNKGVCFFVCFFVFPTMHDAQGIYSEEDSSGDEIRNNDPLQPVIRQLASVCLCVEAPGAELL